MRYKRTLSRSEMVKDAQLKTNALPTRLAVLDSKGQKWILPGTLEWLAKENKCSTKMAAKMFHTVAYMCKTGLLEPAKLGAVAA